MKKEVYRMHDGIPIWQHLMNNSQEYKTILKGSDYGKLAERIGKRELRKLIKFDNFLDKLFPDVTIISTNRRTKKTQRSLEYGDYCVELSYMKHSDIWLPENSKMKYGKKVLIIEIKHGKIEISQQQIRRYSKYIITPSAYFRKADEVKVIFMFFTEINTMNASAMYSLCEFNKEFANKIIDAIPVPIKEPDKNFNLFTLLEVQPC
jgi:hypothetical protein